ncbi:hypothetical protein INR49_024949 [Caranx melampygus]|nr:hypothetical protein INR49_024949 [Caranx melampygus]
MVRCYEGGEGRGKRGEGVACVEVWVNQWRNELWKPWLQLECLIATERREGELNPERETTRPHQAWTQPVADEPCSPELGLRLWLEEGVSLDLRLRLGGGLRPGLGLGQGCEGDSLREITESWCVLGLDEMRMFRVSVCVPQLEAERVEPAVSSAVATSDTLGKLSDE